REVVLFGSPVVAASSPTPTGWADSTTRTSSRAARSIDWVPVAASALMIWNGRSTRIEAAPPRPRQATLRPGARHRVRPGARLGARVSVRLGARRRARRGVRRRRSSGRAAPAPAAARRGLRLLTEGARGCGDVCGGELRQLRLAELGDRAL